MAKRKQKVVGKCPRCKKDLVVRDGRNGKFIACTGYPNCRYTKDYVEPDFVPGYDACEEHPCWDCELAGQDDCTLNLMMDGRMEDVG